MLLAVSLDMQKGSNRKKTFLPCILNMKPGVMLSTLSIEIQFLFPSSRKGQLGMCQGLFNLCSHFSFFSRYTDSFDSTCVQLILTKPIQLCESMPFQRLIHSWKRVY